MYYAEKEAKEVLRKFGFEVLNSIYISKIEELDKISSKIKFPVVIKVFGRRIIHKTKLDGVYKNVNNISEILDLFGKMKKIKGFEGIIIQPQIKEGNEIFLGVNISEEFGHVIALGFGGTNVEKNKEISFRIYPIEKNDAKQMLKESKIFKKLSKKELEAVFKNLIKLNNFIKKYPKLKELDINPLIVKKNFAKIIDARIVF